MDNPIAVMKRYELKYVLDKEQTQKLRDALKGRLEVDKYGLTSIASLYYDTPDYRLIRRSLEKPEYKEKIRLRSYGLAKPDDRVFLELKRKCYGVVYKRRASTTPKEAEAFFKKQGELGGNDQIAREIGYFRDFYKNLVPACLVIYDRVAYFQNDGDLRLTIDYNPRYRFDELNLTTSMEGSSILPEGYTILEVKAQDALPLWLTEILDSYGIRKSSISKYGEAYKAKIAALQKRAA